LLGVRVRARLDPYRISTGCQHFIRIRFKILGNLLNSFPNCLAPIDGTRNRSPTRTSEESNGNLFTFVFRAQFEKALLTIRRSGNDVCYFFTGGTILPDFTEVSS